MPSSGELWTTNCRVRDDMAAQWEQILSAAYVPWGVAIAEHSHWDAYRASLRRWRIDDLALVDGKCGPCSGTRSRHQPADTDGEFVAVMIVQAGAETISQRHIEATMTPADVVAWDSTNRNRFTVREPLSKRGMLIPWTALDEVGGRMWMRDGIKLDRTAPATRLLTSYLDTLLRSLGASIVAVCRKRWAAPRLVCWTALSLITYKHIKSLRLNHKALKEKLPEVHAEYIDVTESRTFEVVQ
jgi:AraC family transcriptional activator of tynA and feaB